MALADKVTIKVSIGIAMESLIGEFALAVGEFVADESVFFIKCSR